MLLQRKVLATAGSASATGQHMSMDEGDGETKCTVSAVAAVGGGAPAKLASRQRVGCPLPSSCAPAALDGQGAGFLHTAWALAAHWLHG